MKLVQIIWLISLGLLCHSAQATENKNQIAHTKLIIIEKLENFKKQDHFVADNFLYTGMQDKKLKAQLNQSIANTAQNFILLYKKPNSPTPTQLLRTLAQGIQQINPDELDTEDREQVATSFEQFLDITGLESSDGILNTWMYGKEINDLIKKNNLSP